MPEHLPNGSWPVYPGHPITTAWFIVKKFPSFEAAMKRTQYGWPEAVGDNDIPGAGEAVYSALGFLERLVKGDSWEVAVRKADDHWRQSKAGGHGRKVAPGLAQANYVKPLLKAWSSWWEAAGAARSR